MHDRQRNIDGFRRVVCALRKARERAEADDLDEDTPVSAPICPDCRAEVGPDLHRCRLRPAPADEAGVEALYRDIGEAGA